MASSVVIVEHTTACGSASSITIEGIAMTRALVRDATRGGFDVHVVASEIVNKDSIAAGHAVTWHDVQIGANYMDVVDRIASGMEHAFAVAPEFGEQLVAVTALLERHGCKLLSQPSRAIALASDKHRSLDRLAREGIAVPATQALHDYLDHPAFPPPVVVKPNHGAGCVGVHLAETMTQVAEAGRIAGETDDPVVQALVHGEALSASAVSIGGKVALVGINTQDVKLSLPGEGGSCYSGGIAGIPHPSIDARCREIAAVAASAFGLSGYFGLDLVLDERGTPWVVEINPRLTTTFVGHERLARRSFLRDMACSTLEEPLIGPGACGYVITRDTRPSGPRVEVLSHRNPDGTVDKFLLAPGSDEADVRATLRGSMHP